MRIRYLSEIHAGGGTESQDWADMLRRMLKWFDKKILNMK